jgi:uncharacterized oligopeptide transporter (OPT) family protein
MAPPDISLTDVANAVTPRTIACAILLGSVVCLANMYFGLQAGMVNSMPMQSALLGFAFFEAYNIISPDRCRRARQLSSKSLPDP